VSPAWIGLGGNLGEPRLALRRALALIGALPDTQLRAVSPAYWTAPWGVSDQPDYLNAVVKLVTRLAPRQLLAALLDIEQRLGRTRDGERWAARVLDLDLLVYDNQTLAEPDLVVPHPRLHQRAFVLVPLNDLSPGLVIPGHGTVAELLQALPAAERDTVRPAQTLDQAGWLNDIQR
jgi:2-amino-4-hydroxy-6-hydroxymethyldihydropteridine diphosphokinase